jgi:hypothetical protein
MGRKIRDAVCIPALALALVALCAIPYACASVQGPTAQATGEPAQPTASPQSSSVRQGPEPPAATTAAQTPAADTPAPAGSQNADVLNPFEVRPTLSLDELEVDADGFAETGEYVYRNEETGEYRYISRTLTVHITRHVDTDPNVVWHEAQIHARGGTLFRMYPFDETDRMQKTAHQTVIAQMHHLVFAINSDYAHLRIGWKATVGLLIRNGEVLSDHTFSKKATKYPNLDNLALLPDGSMLAMGRNALNIDDYVDMGAYDLLAFGPVLVHDGLVNEDGIGRYGWERAPRTAVGMVAPGHYVAIMVEGRHEDSRGWNALMLAQHMAALGATEALNLDGGQSATMLFMGEQIIRVGDSESLTARPRRSAEVLGIGQSAQVQLEAED